MMMSGDPDPLYVVARRVLLDALEALSEHREAVILVGAQAIYLHVGDGDLHVAPYTIDGDLALDPQPLARPPLLGDILHAAGFQPSPSPAEIGRWIGDAGVRIDLLVPEALAGPGSRSAHLDPHGNRIARRAKGLEAALVDHHEMMLAALDPGDLRRLPVKVAGPAALLVAKLHKLAERLNDPRQQRPKDALDIYRLLTSVPTDDLVRALLRLHETDLSAATSVEAMTYLDRQFSTVSASGSSMAASIVGPGDDPDTVAASCAALTQDLLAAFQRSHP